MDEATRQAMFDRADGCCEYCRMPQELTIVPHEIDHIRARKHGGETTEENLALACFYCNSFKGPNVAGFDSLTNTVSPLFNPRTDTWSDHFEWRGPELHGKTAVARATINVLNINLPKRVEHRRLLLASGDFPPHEMNKESPP